MLSICPTIFYFFSNQLITCELSKEKLLDIIFNFLGIRLSAQYLQKSFFKFICSFFLSSAHKSFSCLNGDGDSDYFKLEIPEKMSISFYTSGDTDTYGVLFNCCNDTPSNCELRIDDSNSGDSNNFFINELLERGTYYLKVRHEDKANGTGEYVLHVENVSIDLNKGLVAHYEFEGNAHDSSENGNNGSVKLGRTKLIS
jgi:hypothetical protein